jgi:hypothetical protein
VAILVDELITYPLVRTRSVPGRAWCHMVSDTSLEELHAMAAALGLPRAAFQRDHYDLTPSLRTAAIMLGAEPVGGRELARRRVRVERRGRR